MGLDSVELVMTIEKSFGIAIEDSEAASVRTAGQLLALVMSKLEPGTGQGCLTSHAFYRLRSALLKVTGLPRRAIAPATRTESLWPPATRRAAWSKVAREVGVDLPPLERPAWLVWCATAAVVIGSFTVAFILRNRLGHLALRSLLSVSLASALVLAWAVASATRPAARYVPSGSDTVGGLAQEVLTMNFGLFAAEQRRWCEAEVWDALQDLIVQQLGVKREEVTKEARFVEDLGMD